jgi:hypothetical protein
LFLVQVPEHVTLVLVLVGPSCEFVLAIALENLSVVTGRHCVKAQTPSTVEEHVELDMAIALDARIR